MLTLECHVYRIMCHENEEEIYWLANVSKLLKKLTLHFTDVPSLFLQPNDMILTLSKRCWDRCQVEHTLVNTLIKSVVDCCVTKTLYQENSKCEFIFMYSDSLPAFFALLSDLEPLKWRHLKTLQAIFCLKTLACILVWMDRKILLETMTQTSTFTFWVGLISHDQSMVMTCPTLIHHTPIKWPVSGTKETTSALTTSG